MWGRLGQTLTSPVAAYSLAVFRMSVGLILMLESYEVLKDQGGQRFLDAYYAGSGVVWNVPYPGFEWVRAFPEPWMTRWCIGFGVAGGLLAMGVLTRVAAAVAGVMWSYFFLIEACLFNNHYYLLALLCVLLTVMPSGTVWSVDAWLRRWRRGSGAADAGDSASIAFWSLFVLRGQMLVVYFFGGVAKLNAEWLVTAEPMRITVAKPHVAERVAWLLPDAWVGTVVGWLQTPAFAYFLTYTGTAFDLAIGPLLIWRRTRYAALGLVAVFHSLNHFLLFNDIGWFPLFGFLASLVFLEPDWPVRVLAWLRRPRLAKPDVGWAVAGIVFLPVIGVLLGWKAAANGPQGAPEGSHRSWPSAKWLTAAVVGWMTIQIVVPLRHFAIAGDVNWTTEGDRFSWRMKVTAHRRGPMTIRVDDRGVVAPTMAGSTIHWIRWPNSRRVFRDVEVTSIDWRRMPELFLCFQPSYGQRIIYNPASGQAGAPRTEADSMARITAFWQQTYERALTSDAIKVTYPLDETLRLMIAYVGERPSLAAERAELERIRAAWSGVRDGSIEGDQRQALIAALDAVLEYLTSLADEETSTRVRALLAYTHPFATRGGAEPPGPMYDIWDVGLRRNSPRGGFMEVDVDGWVEPNGGPPVVWADVSTFSRFDWYPQEDAILVEHGDGKREILWNQFAEFGVLQDAIVRSRPGMLHQYAQRVAYLWEEKTGRRPRIYVRDQLALVPYEYQWLVDPYTDLAEVPMRYLSHNAWIMPLERQRAGENRAVAGETVATDTASAQ